VLRTTGVPPARNGSSCAEDRGLESHLSPVPDAASALMLGRVRPPGGVVRDIRIEGLLPGDQCSGANA
jgi:hypothetical protein